MRTSSSSTPAARRGFLLKKFSGAFAALVAALALVLGVTAPASADVHGSAHGVGSDTTQDVMNAFASMSGGAIGSWDATGGGSLPLNGVTFNRPNGSHHGVSALSAATLGVGYPGSTAPLSRGQVAFARSSSGPSVQGTDLTYIPFGIDAVTYATDGSDLNLSEIPLTAPAGQLSLRAIYSTPASGASYTHNGSTYTVGVQGSGADIVPFIPQVGSGTRSFWQGQIRGSFGTAVRDEFIVDGVTESVQVNNGQVTQEVPGAIVPFSIAQWVAQSNNGGSALQNETPGEIAGVEVIDRRWNAELGAVNGELPLDGGVLNPAFPITRSVYNVIHTDDIGQDTYLYQEAINEAFVGSGADLYTATYEGQNLINLFGFGTHPNAGSTTTQGGLTTRFS